MTIGIFNSHAGANCVGNPDNNLEMGTVDINFAGQEGCNVSHFCTWSDNSTNTNKGGLIQSEITALFERGAIPTITITSDTEANMQIALDVIADTTRTNVPLAIRVERVTGGGSLELTADNINFDPLGSLDVQYYGSTGEVLTWVNSNGGSIDSNKLSSYNGGTISIKEDAPITVTVLDFDGVPVENARVLIEAVSGGTATVGVDILTGTTNASGVLTTNFRYDGDQPIEGRVRRATTGTLYRTSNVIATITSTGLDATIFMITDE